MPREVLDIQQVARYLNLSEKQVSRLAARGKLPARRVRNGFEFRKGQIDHWVEARMRDLSRDELAGIEQGVSAHHGLDHTGHFLTPLIPVGGVIVPLGGRTRGGVLRALAAAADEADLVYDGADLVEELEERERLCPTTISTGVALPHPAHPLPYNIARSFVIVGLTASGIPFGCPDGSLTRLFFLLCCKDERTHLHLLVRIGRMLDRATVAALMRAPDAVKLARILQEREAEVRPEQ